MISTHPFWNTVITGLSPYQIEHINRVGDYMLDLSQPPAPLPVAVPSLESLPVPQVSVHAAGATACFVHPGSVSGKVNWKTAPRGTFAVAHSRPP